MIRRWMMKYDKAPRLDIFIADTSPANQVDNPYRFVTYLLPGSFGCKLVEIG